MRFPHLTFALLAAVMCVVAPAALAQPGGDRGAQLLERIKKDCALSDSQAVVVDSLFKSQREQSMNARETYADDRDAMMAAMRELREKTDKAIEGVLTKEQFEKYRAIREEMRSQMRGGMRPPRE
jgi:hypothetical protein